MKKKKLRLGALAAACLLLLGGAVWAAGEKVTRQDMQEETAYAIRETVLRRALQCYVVEGAYPSDLQYLEDNYGLQVNTEDYYVVYEAYAANQPPTVRVVQREEGRAG